MYSLHLLPNGWVGRRFIYYNCYILYVGGIDITCGMILFLLIIISIGYCIGAYYFIGIRD